MGKEKKGKKGSYTDMLHFTTDMANFAMDTPFSALKTLHLVFPYTDKREVQYHHVLLCSCLADIQVHLVFAAKLQ